MKKVVFHEDAKNELIEAIDYYEHIFQGLGLDFKTEVESVIKLIQTFPEICASNDDGTMRMLTHRFPYQIVFFPYQDILWIIAVAHQKRFPEYWNRRI